MLLYGYVVNGNLKCVVLKNDTLQGKYTSAFLNVQPFSVQLVVEQTLINELIDFIQLG